MKKFSYMGVFLQLTLSMLALQGAQPEKIQKDNAPETAYKEPAPETPQWHYIKGVEEILGPNQNAYLANEHFKRAADMNYPPAIKALADSYYSGDGIDQDKVKALELYVKAANMGDGAAQFNAGIVYLRGYAGAPDPNLAFYYLCLTTINADLDEMAQDAAIYRDEAGKLLNHLQLSEIYRKVAKISVKPKRDPNPSSGSKDLHPKMPLKPSIENPERH